MSVIVQYEPNKYIGTGSKLDFDFTFYLLAEEDSLVIIEDSDENQSIKTLGVDYTIEINENNVGGTVNFLIAPSSTETIILARETAQTQPNSYKTSSGFQAKQVETSFDRNTILSQEQQEAIGRSVKQQIGATDNVTLPPADANKLLGWNGEGTDLENKTAAEIGTIIPTSPNTELAIDGGQNIVNKAYGTKSDIETGTEQYASTSPKAVNEYVAQEISVAPYYDGYIKGGLLSNNITTPLKTIDVSSVKARSADDTVNLSIAGTSLNIDTASDWDTGVVPSLINTSIFVWSDDVNGYKLSDSTGSSMDSTKRRVGSFITDNLGDIVPFVNTELDGGGVTTSYEYITDITTGLITTYTNFPLSVPSGITLAVQGYTVIDTGASSGDMWAKTNIMKEIIILKYSTAFTNTRYEILTDNASIDLKTSAVLGANPFAFTTDRYTDYRRD